METAVVVRVPEAEPVISAHRQEHTPDGAEGMPAHVTVLYPFADSALLVAGMVREVRETLAELPSFRFAINRLARFTEPPSVLYGAPEPAAPFVRLTERLRDRFGPIQSVLQQHRHPEHVRRSQHADRRFVLWRRQRVRAA